MADYDDYVMVAAIDFGTTFSGYAFSFKSTPDDIKMNKNWGESLGFQSYKTPTCLLTNPNGELDSFGYDAEQKYGDIVGDESQNPEEWHIYRQFKMMLHKKEEVSRTAEIRSSSCHVRPAMDIFVMSLKYLKDHLIDIVSRQVASSPNASMIRWVITVPAIWSDESKHFMREAAYKAGLIPNCNSGQLVIAFEPEAASLHCRNLDITQFLDNPESIQLRAGTKYIVIDAGGGTVDVTAHEILDNGQVKELLAATGGAWGGKEVDENFIKLLKNVLGARFVKSYQEKEPQQWLALMTTFEKMKRAAKPTGKANLNIPLSWSMGRVYTDLTEGRSIEKAIQDGAEYGVAFANGNLIVKHQTVKDMFKPVIDNIIAHIQDLLSNIKVHPCKYFFLVGGFSESSYLQEAIKERFAGMVDVLIPNEAQMSVIKGAVMFGHRPNEISTRVARRTYGYGHMMPFDPSIHDPKKKKVYEGAIKCEGLFGTFVVKGEEVNIGLTKSIEFSPYRSDLREATFRFFCMDRPPNTPVQYVDDVGVTLLGKVKIAIPDVSKRGLNRKIQLVISFGGTEIQVKAKDLTTGNTEEISLDFLSG